MTVPLLEFVRLVVDGDVKETSRRLAGTPGLATAAASVGATRQGSVTFFFPHPHYMYRGHHAALARRRSSVRSGGAGRRGASAARREPSRCTTRPTPTTGIRAQAGNQ